MSWRTNDHNKFRQMFFKISRPLRSSFGFGAPNEEKDFCLETWYVVTNLRVELSNAIRKRVEYKNCLTLNRALDHQSDLLSPF